MLSNWINNNLGAFHFQSLISEKSKLNKKKTARILFIAISQKKFIRDKSNFIPSHTN